MRCAASSASPATPTPSSWSASSSLAAPGLKLSFATVRNPGSRPLSPAVFASCSGVSILLPFRMIRALSAWLRQIEPRELRELAIASETSPAIARTGPPCRSHAVEPARERACAGDRRGETPGSTGPARGLSVPEPAGDSRQRSAHEKPPRPRVRSRVVVRRAARPTSSAIAPTNSARRAAAARTAHQNAPEQPLLVRDQVVVGEVAQLGAGTSPRRAADRCSLRAECRAPPRRPAQQGDHLDCSRATISTRASERVTGAIASCRSHRQRVPGEPLHLQHGWRPDRPRRYPVFRAKPRSAERIVQREAATSGASPGSCRTSRGRSGTAGARATSFPSCGTRCGSAGPRPRRWSRS
jgi:hypothetical protein